MKLKFSWKLLCCLGLMLLMMMGLALAEESDVQQAELPLFTAGRYPVPMRMRSVIPEEFYDYIAEQLRAQEDKIYVLDYALSPSALQTALSNVINDNPDLFYIGATISYTTGNTTGNVYNLMPQYLYKGEDLQNRIAAFNARVSELAAYARSVSSSPVGQMLALNDYFCIHYEYDDSLTIYSPDKFFTGGSGVCQAYMLAYAAVLDELGIANTHATSYAMKHTWNLVQLGDDWYHVDVTWNDPANGVLQTRYEYFLLSDDGMLDSDHYDWTAKYSAANAAYDGFFWRGLRTPMAILGNTVYYVDSAVNQGMRTLRSWAIGAKDTAALHEFSIQDANGGYSYNMGFGPVCTDGKQLYYAARGNLYALSTSGGSGRLVYSSASDARHIYSCWMENGALQMLLGDENFANTRVFTLPVSGASARLMVPASVQEIGDEAFMAAPAAQVVLPKGLKTIGDRAFAGCSNLRLLNIPAGVSSIAASAFDGCGNLLLQVSAGSYGETYARAQGIHYVIE